MTLLLLLLVLLPIIDSQLLDHQYDGNKNDAAVDVIASLLFFVVNVSCIVVLRLLG